MAMSVQQPLSHLWDTMLHLTKSAQDKNNNLLLWAVQLNSSLNSAAMALPSIKLAHLNSLPKIHIWVRFIGRKGDRDTEGGG
ncbi:unnamed protein product [Prunus armeniaca]